MFIQTEPMPDINRMKFYPGEPVLVSGTLEFSDKETAERSPLVSRLFEIEGVMQVTLYDEFVTVKKQENFNWQILKPMILGAIMDHYSTGKPTLLEIKDPKEELEFTIKDSPEDAETITQIQEIINTRIKPAAEQMGGAVTYKAFNKGTLYVELTGPTMALVGGMTNVIGHHVPQVTAVKDFRDAIPKKGLETPEGRAIQAVLDERINPSVAGHGGHISLIDVTEDTAFIRLEGGCQGCGMADVTLKQGIEVEIKGAVPSIAAVLDVTDHAGGDNPYYSPGKGGPAPY